MTLRTTAGPLTLARTTLGGPREIGGKLRRLLRTARLFADRREVERRLEALAERGLAPARLTRLQLLFGGLDILRFRIEPGAREYDAQQGISFGFHQLLRADPHFAAAERAFATLPGYLTCSARLPRDLRSLWRRLRSLERFPLEAPAR